MGYANESGYTPETIEDIMISIMNNINTQFGTTYTYDSFVATNFYKYFYALAQRMQQNEIKTSEIFLKLQQYFVITNERISRPVATPQGIIDKIESLVFGTGEDAFSVQASVKPPLEIDAGKSFICVDIDETHEDYAAQKLLICQTIKNSIAAGIVTQGDQEETIVLTNGQAFDFKFSLPDRIPVFLKLTLTLSENNQLLIGDPSETKLKLLANIRKRYRIGKNFEPERYFEVSDAPWAGDVLLEWTDDVTDGELDDTPTWHDEIFDADFDELFDIALDRIELIEA